MCKAKRLSKKQLMVIDNLFEGTLDEQAVLDKYKVKRSVFEKWLADDQFIEQFNARITGSFRQSRLIIARYAPLATTKLVELTESESQETARKACLDIISMGSQGLAVPDKSGVPVDKSDLRDIPPELSAETASRILATLAETPK